MKTLGRLLQGAPAAARKDRNKKKTFLINSRPSSAQGRHTTSIAMDAFKETT
jgi:hypothetical protein